MFNGDMVNGLLLVTFSLQIIRCFMLTVYDVTQDSGEIIVISQSMSGIQCRLSLGLINESIWIKIKIDDGYDLLTGNHYFPPDT
jgi:hypothetical protein